MILPFFVILFILPFISLSINEKCYGLTMEGGGTKGVYDAGVYTAFSEYLAPNNSMPYNMISGVSVGALTAAILSAYNDNETKEAAKLLSETWLHLTREEMFQNWKNGGFVRGLFFENGIFDSTPERILINKTFQKAGGNIKRKISIAVVDVNAGTYVTDKNITNENLVNYTMGTSAMDGALPAEHLDNTMYVDAGTLYNIDLVSPIEYCRKLGYSDKDIIIDFIFLVPARYPYFNSTGAKASDILGRKDEMQSHLERNMLLEDAFRLYPRVNFRYQLMPKHILYKPIFGLIPIVTDPVVLQRLFDTGYNETVEAIKGLNKEKTNYIGFIDLYTD